MPISYSAPFTADTTLKTADTTLKRADATTLGTVTSEYQRLDLFEDEKISVTSAITDLSDISKTLTDFSQSFTVPATKNNNKIFKYWYENKIDNGFDSRVRILSYINLDGTLFRNGLIQLEKSNLKNNKAQDYTITFFGNLVSLKDKFSGLLLTDLKTNTNFNINYNGTIVANKIFIGNNDNVKFPLISSLRPWNAVQFPINANDITNNANPINYKELFPALRLSAVFNMIETQFGITFGGSFITSSGFTNLFLWLKNSDIFTPKFISVTPISSSVSYFLNRQISTWDVVTNSFTYVNPEPYVGVGTMTVSAFYSANCSSSLIGQKYFVEVYFNGVFLSDYEDIIFSAGGNGVMIANILPLGTNFLYGNASEITQGVYTFKVACEVPANWFNAKITYTSSWGFFPSFSWETTIVTFPDFSTTSTMDIRASFPEMKIEELLSGIIKMFNLAVYVETPDTYLLETLENYYALGNIIDISEYVVQDTIAIERVKWYKKVSFMYSKCDLYFSSIFLGNNGRSYGDLLQSFPNDESEYKISLPFENMLFSKLKPNLVVGYSLSNTLQAKKPKAVLLYDYNTNNLVPNPGTPFFFNNGNATSSKNDYNGFGSEFTTISLNSYYSLNWGEELSVFSENPLTGSLYYEYYLTYLKNIYNKKARILKLKCRLPLKIITTLKLYDRIKIRDKRYLINNFTTDLTTLDVSMELITDFRLN